MLRLQYIFYFFLSWININNISKFKIFYKSEAPLLSVEKVHAFTLIVKKVQASKIYKPKNLGTCLTKNSRWVVFTFSLQKLYTLVKFGA